MENYKERPAETDDHLTHEEEQFLAEYGSRLDRLLEEVSSHPGGRLNGFLRSLLRTDTWRVIANRRLAEQLLDKKEQADRNAQLVEQKLAAVETSIDDFADFVGELGQGSNRTLH